MYKNVIEEIRKNGFYIFNEDEFENRKVAQAFGNYCLDLQKSNQLNQLGAVDIRVGEDGGMVDIRVDAKLLPESFSKFYENHFKKFQIISNAYVGPSSIAGKIYINKGITKTRGPHTDGNVKQLKMFIYCTDVGEEDGPYSYAPMSHKVTIKKIISFLTNKIFFRNHDANSYLFNIECVPVIGSAGTHLISDQRGIHRGTPQANGEKSRVLLVFDTEYSAL